MSILHFHAELHRRQPWVQILGVKRHRATLQDRTEVIPRGVFACTRSPTVEIQRRFEFPQTVVDAKDKSWPEPPTHQLALAAPDLVAPGLERVAEVRFQREPNAPRFVRRFDF